MKAISARVFQFVLVGCIIFYSIALAVMAFSTIAGVDFTWKFGIPGGAFETTFVDGRPLLERVLVFAVRSVVPVLIIIACISLLRMTSAIIRGFRAYVAASKQAGFAASVLLASVVLEPLTRIGSHFLDVSLFIMRKAQWSPSAVALDKKITVVSENHLIALLFVLLMFLLARVLRTSGQMADLPQ